MVIPIPDRPGQLFNNADSFAQVFDQAWGHLDRVAATKNLGRDQKLERALEACAEHPFMVSDPTMALQVAQFRLRLLGL